VILSEPLTCKGNMTHCIVVVLVHSSKRRRSGCNFLEAEDSAQVFIPVYRSGDNPAYPANDSRKEMFRSEALHSKAGAL